jgi:3'-5' exoribonuclease
VGEYRGTPQFTAGRIRPAAEDDPVDVSALVPTAPIDRRRVMEELRETVNTIADPDYRAVAEDMLTAHGDALEAIPAAKSVHHAFLGGLLMHTANMLRLADFLAGMYPETVDRSLLLAGTLLHDMAKEQEFVFSQLGLATDYSVRGQLLGHLVMGAQETAAAAARLGVPEEKSVLLQHLILSHHGEPEFGAAVRPLCAEAELLSLIDAIDSRMEIYRETYETMDADTFSPRIFALEKKIFKHS